MTDFSSPELTLGAPGAGVWGVREKGLGLGASRIEEPTGALEQRSPAPETPGEPALRMGCRESRARGPLCPTP